MSERPGSELLLRPDRAVCTGGRLGLPLRCGGSLTASKIPDAQARDAYLEVEPAGHFLGSSHTMANYQTAFYEAALSDSENVESWEEAGSKDMLQRAYERWNVLLRDYEAPAIDPAIDDALTAFVALRKEQLPDAWY